MTLNQAFMEITEELRIKNKITQTKLAQLIWSDFEPQAALMRYRRLLTGRDVTLHVGQAISRSLSYDFSRLIVLATERVSKL